MEEEMAKWGCLNHQALQTDRACAELRKMLEYRLSDDPHDSNRSFPESERERRAIGAAVLVAACSPIFNSGVRGALTFMAEKRMASCFCTTIYGMELDMWWALSGKSPCGADPFMVGFGSAPSNAERLRDNACIQRLFAFYSTVFKAFEAWPERGVYTLTPARFLRLCGSFLKDEKSLLFQCHKQDIWVFAPGLTDGLLGVYLTQHPEHCFSMDLTADLRALNTIVRRSARTGSFILGGGLAKHHVNKASLMNDRGADFAVYVSPAEEFDGSDTGASPEEAKGCGKVSLDATAVKVFSEASLVVPALFQRAIYPAWEADKEFWKSQQRTNPFDTYLDALDRARGWSGRHPWQ